MLSWESRKSKVYGVRISDEGSRFEPHAGSWGVVSLRLRSRMS